MKVGIGTGIIPLPNDRIVRSQVEMSIEKTDPVVAFTGGSETAPTGANWDWCG
jgi:hypothetical protein